LSSWRTSNVMDSYFGCLSLPEPPPTIPSPQNGPQTGPENGQQTALPTATPTATPAHPATDFTAFFEQQRDPVRYWLGARVRDGKLRRSDFDDVLQDIFLRAWESREQCREPAKWIIGIAKHALLEYGRQQGLWRKRNNAAELIDRYEHESGAVWTDDSDRCRRSLKKTEPDGLRRQIAAVGLDARTEQLLRVEPTGLLVEALRLHYVEGLDWKQCASKVGRSDRWLRNKRSEAGLSLTPQHRRESGA